MFVHSFQLGLYQRSCISHLNLQLLTSQGHIYLNKTLIDKILCSTDIYSKKKFPTMGRLHRSDTTWFESYEHYKFLPLRKARILLPSMWLDFQGMLYRFWSPLGLGNFLSFVSWLLSILSWSPSWIRNLSPQSWFVSNLLGSNFLLGLFA